MVPYHDRNLISSTWTLLSYKGRGLVKYLFSFSRPRPKSIFYCINLNTVHANFVLERGRKTSFLLRFPFSLLKRESQCPLHCLMLPSSH